MEGISLHNMHSQKYSGSITSCTLLVSGLLQATEMVLQGKSLILQKLEVKDMLFTWKVNNHVGNFLLTSLNKKIPCDFSSISKAVMCFQLKEPK